MSQLNNTIENITDKLIEVVEKKLIKTIDKFEEKLLKSLEKKYEDNLKKTYTKLYYTVNDLSSNTLLYFDKNKKLKMKWYEELIEKNSDISLNFNEYNRLPPLVRKNDFEIMAANSYFIVNNTKGPTYIELPYDNKPYIDSEFCNNKEIIIKNINDHPIYSKYNDIKQLNSDEISNVIMTECNKDKYVRMIINKDKVWQVTHFF